VRIKRIRNRRYAVLGGVIVVDFSTRLEAKPVGILAGRPPEQIVGICAEDSTEPEEVRGTNVLGLSKLPLADCCLCHANTSAKLFLGKPHSQPVLPDSRPHIHAAMIIAIMSSMNWACESVSHLYLDQISFAAILAGFLS